jgi:ADP-ribosylglycohydrolase
VTYKEIIKAKETLGLPEQASWEEIKTRYKELIRQWHPDKCTSDQDVAQYNEMTAELNAAYAIIRAYCTEYQFSFREQDIRKYMSKEEWWFERFGNDPLWGPARKG